MKAIAIGFVTGLIVYLAMTMVFGLGLVDSMYIALTIATAAASAIALSEREANLGVVAAFAAISIVASLLKFVFPGLVSTSAILVKLPNADIYIPTDLLPYLALALVGLLGVAKAMGWSVGRTMLVILGLASWLAYYMVPDQAAKLFALTLISIIAAIPLVSEEKREEKGLSRLLSVAPIPIIATIDLTAVNYAGLLVPLLLFIAVDPTTRIKSIARDLAAICILSLVLLMVFGITMGL
ncbi:MAG: hypothetical protein LM568_01410 [Desulfurococcaceae archaeon]|nr:hypothetical protein [Desulfurococcaceae archaeon]